MAVIIAFLGAFVGGVWAWRYELQIIRVLHPVSVGAAPDPVTPIVAPTRPAPACSSVLGWEVFAVTSVLTLDGTVLVGCRRLDAPAGDIRTMVLLIGDDERAGQATAMLDRWQRRGARLRLRPTAVSGAIELREDERAILRAPLLLA